MNRILQKPNVDQNRVERRQICRKEVQRFAEFLENVTRHFLQRIKLGVVQNCANRRACKMLQNAYLYAPVGGQKTQAFWLAPQKNLLSVMLVSHFQSICGVPRCDDGMMWWCDVVMMGWCDDEIIGWWRPFWGPFWSNFSWISKEKH